MDTDSDFPGLALKTRRGMYGSLEIFDFWYIILDEEKKIDSRLNKWEIKDEFKSIWGL